MDQLKGYLLTILIVISTCLTGMATLAGDQRMMSVQVKKTHIRSSPSFLGGVMTEVFYGDQVELDREEGAWDMVKLQATPIEGWIHASALTRKRIILRPGDSDIAHGATSDEVALAGKGFNKEVEKEFRTRNPHIDFSTIERMERIVISGDQMRRFLTEGGLPFEGGAR